MTRIRGNDGILDYAGFFREHYRQIPPLFILTMLNNIAFCQVAIALGIRGENSVLSQYADAGAQAIAEAVAAVREGRASVALAGGSGEELTAMSLARCLNLGVLSEGSCRPFAADRNGTLPGEGGGVLVLEALSRARRRNAPCLAEVSGFGSAGELDGAGSAPTVAAIRKAIESALSEARLAPETIDLIIGNGDGGREADRNEMLAIEELFGASLDRTPVVSFKGSLGHLFAGAPLVDAALGILAIRDGVVPVMAAGFTPDPAFHATLPVGDPLRKVVQRVLVNAQGFAGQSASFLLSRVPEAA